MRIAIIAFTGRGSRRCRQVGEELDRLGYEVTGAIPQKYEAEMSGGPPGIRVLEETAGAWVGQAFRDAEAVLFVGAAGIAVRLIAPYIEDKSTDPAVLVMDETGKYCISLLSGHLGGANELARLIGRIAGAEPVITTATDLNDKFAVDIFAKNNGLKISDMRLAKQISAEILDGGRVGFHSDFPVEGNIPEELSGREDQRYKIRITMRDDQNVGNILYLYPPVVTAGIGCRKGAEESVIEAQVAEAFRTAGVARQCLKGIASIDRKAGEPGLIAFAANNHCPFSVFSAEDLAKIQGDFTESDFVRKTVGVDNVCERAAVAGSGGHLLTLKQAGDGVTVALAAENWKGKI